MQIIKNAKWIKSPQIIKEGSICFSKNFNTDKKIKAATLEATAYGVYNLKINGKKVGDGVLAPGWTSYQTRLQVETHDVTSYINKNINTIIIETAPGWKYFNHFGLQKLHLEYLAWGETAALCALKIDYDDGTSETITTDSSWQCYAGKTVYSHLYNGCTYDANFTCEPKQAVEFPCKYDNLIDLEGEIIKEHEHLPVKEVIRTPKGELVLDFGQNMTGYVQFKIKGEKGKKYTLQHGEVLDKDGNFYNDNYRSAKAESSFISDGEEHIFKPEFNFFGFRYIKLNGWEDVNAEDFTAIAVHSDIKRTGYFECSDERLNKLFSNVIWGQKSNFLDVPTDCPQRDERLGWTGDAQVFVKTASYNFDVEKFFTKWLADLRADQKGWGAVPHVIPNVFSEDDQCSAAWADASTVCPWQIYLTYGNTEILKNSLHSMERYLDYIKEHTWDYLWANGGHFGDWLNLDLSSDKDCSIGTDKDLIATAFFIYSSEIYIKACAVCGESSEDYPELREKYIKSFRSHFMENGRIKAEFATQTACTLACHFGISDNIAETAKQLNELVTECGHLKTGFVGTPYLLHALSDNGFSKTAYDLLLREEYPSWLFSVKMGATTIWEHWDSVREDGTMWSTGMNSFNHYAYGSVADWIYGDMLGIKIDEKDPAFKHIKFAPLTDSRLTFAKAAIETRYGTVKSEWKTENEKTTYTFTVPEGCTAEVVLNGKTVTISAGTTELN